MRFHLLRLHVTVVQVVTVLSQSCDKTCVSDAKCDAIVPGGAEGGGQGDTCYENKHWVGCACSECQSWREACGCDVPTFQNAEVGCVDEAGAVKVRLLHNEVCRLNCTLNSSTHINLLRCQDGQLFPAELPDAPPGVLPVTPVCYDTPPATTVCELEFLDEDTGFGVASGTVIFKCGASSDVQHFKLFWGTSTGKRLGNDGPIATVPASLDGQPSHYQLRSVSMPVTATQLLAYPANVYGEATVPWSVTFIDLVTSTGSGMPLLRAPLAEEAFELQVSGDAIAQFTDWFLAVGASSCSGDSTLQLPIAQLEFHLDGGGNVSRLSWSTVLPHGGRHALCASNTTSATVEAVAIVPVVELNYNARGWVAGDTQVVQVLGLDRHGQASWMAVVPRGQECNGSSVGAVQGFLAGEYIDQGGSLHQEWHVRPEMSGEYEVCVGAASATSSQPTPTHGLETVSVGPCSGHLSSHRCQSASSLDDVCTSLNGTLFSESGCQCRNITSDGIVLPLIAAEVGIGVSAGERHKVFSGSMEEDDIASVDVAPDASYAAFAVPAEGTVQMLRLDDWHATEVRKMPPKVVKGPCSSKEAPQDLPECSANVASEAERSTLQELVGSLSAVRPKNFVAGGRVSGEPRCHYVAPEVVESEQGKPGFMSCGRDEGIDASEARFLYPTAVRVAPSGTFWLIVDAWGHRVLRLDVATWRLRTVAGSGPAGPLPTSTGWFTYYFLQWLNPISILSGTFEGDGGRATEARLDIPWDVAIHPEDEERFLLVDRRNQRVRLVDHGIISTAAGSGPHGSRQMWMLINMKTFAEGGHGQDARTASFVDPSGVEWLPGGYRGFVITDRKGARIWWVDECGVSYILARASAGMQNPFQPRLRRTMSHTELLLSQGCTPNPEGGNCIPRAQKVMYVLPLPQSMTTANASCVASNPASAGIASEAQESVFTPFNFLSKSGEAENEGVISSVWGVGSSHDGAVYAVDGSQGAVYQVRRRPKQCGDSASTDSYSITDGRCCCRSGMSPLSNGSSECTRCSVGSYCTNGVFETACAWKGMTTFALIGSASPSAETCGLEANLPNGTFCLDALEATSVEQCVCPHGYYTDLTSEACEECPEGLLCPSNTSLDFAANPDCRAGKHGVQLQNGFWAKIGGGGHDFRVYKCRRAAHCHWYEHRAIAQLVIERGCAPEGDAQAHCAAQGGEVGGCPGECPEQREGWLCGRCTAGHWEDSEGLCRTCGPTAGGLWLTCQCIVIGILLSGFYFFQNDPRGGKMMATNMISYALNSAAESVLQIEFLVMIELVPPVPFTNILAPIAIILVPGYCVWNNTPELRYPLRVMQPFFLLALFFVLWAIARVTQNWRASRKETPPCCMNGRFQAYVKTTWNFFRTAKMEPDKIMNTYLFLIVGFYVAVAKIALCPFQTHREYSPYHVGNVEQEDSVWLYPDIAFGSDAWLQLIPPFVLILAFLIGVFAYHIYITLRAPKEFQQSKKFQTRHKYFHAKFRPDRYYWGLAAMSRGVLVNIVALNPVTNLLDRDRDADGTPFFQVMAIFTINVVFLILLCVCAPYRVPLNTHLDIFLNVMILLIIGRSAVKVDEQSNFMVFVFVLACAIILVYTVVRLAQTAAFSKRWKVQQEGQVRLLAKQMLDSCQRITLLSSYTLVIVCNFLSAPERKVIFDRLWFLPPDAQEHLPKSGPRPSVRTRVRTVMSSSDGGSDIDLASLTPRSSHQSSQPSLPPPSGMSLTPQTAPELQSRQQNRNSLNSLASPPRDSKNSFEEAAAVRFGSHFSGASELARNLSARRRASMPGPIPDGRRSERGARNTTRSSAWAPEQRYLSEEQEANQEAIASGPLHSEEGAVQSAPVGGSPEASEDVAIWVSREEEGQVDPIDEPPGDDHAPPIEGKPKEVVIQRMPYLMTQSLQGRGDA